MKAPPKVISYGNLFTVFFPKKVLPLKHLNLLTHRKKFPGAGEEYIKEEMKDMFGGICVKQFILFFGEHLQYYITEMEDGKEKRSSLSFNSFLFSE